MIEAQEVSRVYGTKQPFTALDGVSFEIPTGATAAIIGKSGSGKSTLMHLLGGLDHPTAGRIIVDGQTLGELSHSGMDRFRAEDMGFVFQSFFIEANQTCYQNVALPLEINRVARRLRRAKVEQALEQVGLTEKIYVRAGDLSGGQKQRLAIARAIVNQPKILLADEPTGNLDSATGHQVIELLFGLNRNLGCTLVIVTHDRDLAEKCDYRIEISDGRIVQVEAPKGVLLKLAKKVFGRKRKKGSADDVS